MRDPLDDLSDLRGVDIDLLPAHEIRARGDRLRRRRATLSVIGSAAAVAAVALVAGLLGGGTERGAPAPATTTPSADITRDPTAYPTDQPPPDGGLAEEFPLAVGLPETNDDGSAVEVVGEPGSEDLVLCGTTAWTSTRAMDLAGTSYSAPEDFRARTLLLYPSPQEAAGAVELARTSVLACPSEEIGGTEQVYTPAVVSSEDPMGEESVTFVQRYRAGDAFDTGLTVYRLVRVGPALLLTVDYAEANGSAQSRSDFFEATEASGQRVVDEMRIFAQSPAEGTGSVIPADFPLDHEQVAMTGDGGEMTGPSADAPGLGTITLCDRDVWPASFVDRLAANATGPEYEDARELVTFPDAGAAVDVMTRLRQQVRACPSEQVEGPVGAVDRIHSERQVDLGYENLTFAMYLGDTAPGLIVYQFVRVGSGVLVLSESSEGNESYVVPTVATLTDVSEVLAPQMCVFTEAGCSPSEPE